MSIFVMPVHEIEGSVIFRNVDKYLSVMTALHSRRLASSVTPLWEIYTSHKFIYLHQNSIFLFPGNEICQTFRNSKIMQIF